MQMQTLVLALLALPERVKGWLDGKKLWKEELRKVGLVLIGLGITGPLINGKQWMFPLIFLGCLMEYLGLSEDSTPEDDDNV